MQPTTHSCTPTHQSSTHTHSFLASCIISNVSPAACSQLAFCSFHPNTLPHTFFTQHTVFPPHSAFGTHPKSPQHAGIHQHFPHGSWASTHILKKLFDQFLPKHYPKNKHIGTLQLFQQHTFHLQARKTFLTILTIQQHNSRLQGSWHHTIFFPTHGATTKPNPSTPRWFRDQGVHFDRTFETIPWSLGKALEPFDFLNGKGLTTTFLLPPSLLSTLQNLPPLETNTLEGPETLLSPVFNTALPTTWDTQL